MIFSRPMLLQIVQPGLVVVRGVSRPELGRAESMGIAILVVVVFGVLVTVAPPLGWMRVRQAFIAGGAVAVGAPLLVFGFSHLVTTPLLRRSARAVFETALAEGDERSIHESAYVLALSLGRHRLFTGDADLTAWGAALARAGLARPRVVIHSAPEDAPHAPVAPWTPGSAAASLDCAQDAGFLRLALIAESTNRSGVGVLVAWAWLAIVHAPALIAARPGTARRIEFTPGRIAWTDWRGRRERSIEAGERALESRLYFTNDSGWRVVRVRGAGTASPKLYFGWRHNDRLDEILSLWLADGEPVAAVVEEAESR